MNDDWMIEPEEQCRLPRTGYRLQLQLRPGVPEDERRLLLRRLEDYCRARTQDLSGYTWRLLVSGGYPLSVEDQFALVMATLEWPQLAGVRIGPLQSADLAEAEELEEDAPYLQLWADDPVLASLSQLHRSGRIKAAQLVQALGGYVRPARAE